MGEDLGLHTHPSDAPAEQQVELPYQDAELRYQTSVLYQQRLTYPKGQSFFAFGVQIGNERERGNDISRDSQVHNLYEVVALCNLMLLCS